MKRCLLLVFAVLVSVVFVSSVYAQSPAVIPDKTEAADSKAAPGKKRLLRARGEVVSVDYASKTMVVKGTREVLAEMSFDVSNARSGRRHKIEDVKPGDRVAVSFTEADGKMVAICRQAPPSPRKEALQKAPGRESRGSTVRNRPGSFCEIEAYRMS